MDIDVGDGMMEMEPDEEADDGMGEEDGSSTIEIISEFLLDGLYRRWMISPAGHCHETQLGKVWNRLTTPNWVVPSYFY
jgi:hypothetical protein